MIINALGAWLIATITMLIVWMMGMEYIETR